MCLDLLCLVILRGCWLMEKYAVKQCLAVCKMKKVGRKNDK